MGPSNSDCEELNINGIDFDAYNQYLCAIKEILLIKRDNDFNNLNNIDLMMHDMQKLCRTVIGRKERKKKLVFKERFDKESSPYKLIHQLLELEEIISIWSWVHQTQIAKN